MNKFLQKLLILSCILFYNVNQVYPQSVDSYSTLRSKGVIPPDFNLSSEIKYKDRKKENVSSKSRFERRAQDRFLLMSSYYNDFLLRSGRIVFGDTISEYVNQVADVLLKNQPELRDKVRFYVLRSPIVNAYSIDNGIILISTGLISRLENEAQLAFIIGHELIHYTKKHAINQFVETEKMKKGKKEYRHLGFDEKVLLKFSYSKEDEFIADKESVLQFLIGSPYDFSEVDKVFDILNFHHLPYKDIPFDVDFIKPKYHVFSDDLWLKEVEFPKAAEDFSDTKSTHPNVKVRQHIVTDLIAKNEIKVGAKKFVNPESQFFYIRDLARFENLNCHIINNQMAQAYYNVFIMSQDYKDNYFVDKAHAYILYSIAYQKISKNVSDAIDSHRDYSGYWQQLFYFFRNIDKKQLNGIAANKVFQIYKKYPEDEFLKLLANELIDMLVFESNFTITDFAKEFVNIEVVDTVKTEGLSRRRSSRVETNRNILIDVINDPEFLSMFNASFEKLLASNQESARKNFSDKKSKKKKESIALNSNTIFVFDPNCNVFYLSRKEPYQFIESENLEYNIVEQMKRVTSEIDINLIFVDPRLIQNVKIQQYNDSELVKDWLNSKFSSNTDNDKFISWMSQDISNLVERNNSKYLFYSKLDVERGVQRTVHPFVVFSGILFFPAIPFIVYHYVSYPYAYNFSTAIIDFETGKVVRTKHYRSKEKPNNSFYRSIFHKEFSLVKKSKK